MEHNEIKVLSFEKNLPGMIQEIMDYYFENRLSKAVANYVTKADLEKYTAPKLDRSVFDDYVRRQIAIDNN